MELFKDKKDKLTLGFTLVELLIVIAIIGVLASIVMVSLNNARRKARDGAIKAQLTQFRTILNLEYNDTGSYTALQPDTWFPDTTCDSVFSGSYAVQAREICNTAITLAGTWTDTGSNPWGGPYSFYVGNISSNANSYSMMVPLNSKNTFYCMGSSGVSDTEDPSDFLFQSKGCYDNP